MFLWHHHHFKKISPNSIMKKWLLKIIFDRWSVWQCVDISFHFFYRLIWTGYYSWLHINSHKHKLCVSMWVVTLGWVRESLAAIQRHDTEEKCMYTLLNFLKSVCVWMSVEIIPKLIISDKSTLDNTLTITVLLSLAFLCVVAFGCLLFVNVL